MNLSNYIFTLEILILASIKFYFNLICSCYCNFILFFQLFDTFYVCYITISRLWHNIILSKQICLAKNPINLSWKEPLIIIKRNFLSQNKTTALIRRSKNRRPKSKRNQSKLSWEQNKPDKERKNTSNVLNKKFNHCKSSFNYTGTIHTYNVRPFNHKIRLLVTWTII